jgi:three-Cys-motif partner protein
MSNKEFVFLFNESDAERYAQLEEVVENLKETRRPWPSNVKVSVGNSTFEETANEILAYLEQQQARLAPTFAFVDPFGVKGLPMDLLRRLLSFDKCELFVYFDFNTVNRFATASNIDRHLEDLFGTDAYRGVQGLTGVPRKAFLHDLYQTQLVEVCGFPYVKSFEMVNETGHTGYYLFYGTRSVTGLRVMKEAMWKVDPGGGQKFSDILAGQDVLFQLDVDTAPLQQELAEHFRGQTVNVETLDQYVLINTPYASSHLKKLTLKPMQEARLITSPNQKRKGTYPAGTLVAFAP